MAEHLVRKARNLVRHLIQSYGTKRLKAWLWNAEFASGRWDCLRSTAGDCVYPYIERFAAKGDILDLGCGSGNTANELDPGLFRSYTGVDISDAAIQQAEALILKSQWGERAHYIQGEILSCMPPEKYDVILFRDSIYYVPFHKIRGMLDRYSACLQASGVFIVRMWSWEGKYAEIVGAIERNFEVVETHAFESPKAFVIVFRPKQPVIAQQTSAKA